MSSPTCRTLRRGGGCNPSPAGCSTVASRSPPLWYNKRVSMKMPDYILFKSKNYEKPTYCRKKSQKCIVFVAENLIIILGDDFSLCLGRFLFLPSYLSHTRLAEKSRLSSSFIFLPGNSRKLDVGWCCCCCWAAALIVTWRLTGQTDSLRSAHKYKNGRRRYSMQRS